MRIGELARRTHVTTKTIRYYEDIGVLPLPDRAANGYREYPDEAVDRLIFVRDAQAAGLTLTEISAILDLRGRGESTCRHVVDLLEHHLAAIDRQLRTLRETRRALGELTERARGLDPADCTDPNRCQTITPAGRPGAEVRETGGHLHAAPGGHRH